MPAPSLVNVPVPETTPPSIKSPALVLTFMTSQSFKLPDQPLLMFSVSVPSPPLSSGPLASCKNATCDGLFGAELKATARPRLNAVPSYSSTPDAMFSVSSPDPREMLPSTTAPVSIVTTAFPSPSIMATPDVALTLEVESTLISTAAPSAELVEMPAPDPPLTVPDVVTSSLPVPLLVALMPSLSPETGSTAAMVRSVPFEEL